MLRSRGEKNGFRKYSADTEMRRVRGPFAFFEYANCETGRDPVFNARAFIFVGRCHKEVGGNCIALAHLDNLRTISLSASVTQAVFLSNIPTDVDTYLHVSRRATFFLFCTTKCR